MDRFNRGPLALRHHFRHKVRHHVSHKVRHQVRHKVRHHGRCTKTLSRAVEKPLALAAMAMTAVWPLPAPALGDPPPTQVITAVAVDPNGAPINGWQEAPSQGNVNAVAECTTPSPSAVADNVYYCSPTAADADTCWPSTPGSLLCVQDPWGELLHRVSYGGPLPQVQPIASPDPYALVLDDGARCRLRNGGAWGGRDDGYVGVFGCGAPDANLAVLWLPSSGAGTCIDRSTPVWTVKLGRLGSPSGHFPPPATRVVTTAWFAGAAAPGDAT